MYDYRYGANLFVILELQLKLKIDFLPMGFDSILYIIISNKNLLSANFRNELNSARIDKISTKMYQYRANITQLVGTPESTMQ